MDYEDSFIQLVDDDGEEFNFEHVMTFDYNDKKYIVLTPCEEFPEEDEDEEAEEGCCCCGHDHDGEEECDCGCDCEDCEEEAELIILEVVPGEDGTDTFLSIEDDDELDEVYNVFLEMADTLSDEEE